MSKVYFYRIENTITGEIWENPVTTDLRQFKASVWRWSEHPEGLVFKGVVGYDPNYIGPVAGEP